MSSRNGDENGFRNTFNNLGNKVFSYRKLVFAVGFVYAFTGRFTPASAIEDVTRVPFHSEDGFIWVETSLFEQSHTFLLDTGTPCNAVDWSLVAEDSDLKIIKEDVNSRVGLLQTPFPIVLRGTDIVFSGETLAVDTGPVRRSTGVNAMGVVGVIAIGDYAITINFAEQVLTFSPTAGDNRDSVRLSVNRDRNQRPSIQCLVANEKDESFLIDTGFNGAIALKSELFDELVAAGSITAVYDTSSSTFNGVERHRKGVLDEMSIGGMSVRRAPVNESDVNLVGTRLLNRFVTTIQEGDLWLRRSANFGDEFTRDLSGLMLMADNGSICVFGTVAGSQADVAGMKSGDRIVSVNRLPFTGNQLTRLRELLSTNTITGKCSIDIEILRGDLSTKVFTLILDSSLK